MEPINEYKGVVYPLEQVNVDTDQIIPKQFLKRIERQGFGQFLFYNWRFDDDGRPRSDFNLNEEQYRNATILVAGKNFGCGSSREHAPWALLDYGFKVVIAPSFADIFYNNCVKNGILPIALNQEIISQLFSKARNGYELFVELDKQQVSDENGPVASFEIDPYWKEMLLNGWDEVSRTLSLEDQIKLYEEKQFVGE
ncbi:3-isopropylmalate dehydratase small subunit [Pseudalkalibacillus hwajinpoensis]|uniref:3-isopropylmalate dehydratase small subunit n=1 Tax=Guptibacillus hwajinpoensis TaxID=208199 RepID=A0A4U1MG11_9BACL|nr:3-isopropylmalate dehydratase small subunit [Pseudalkalibacillus hwajinpoensis]TKD69322.1 3-isopropylmalate dehydratase small subunit [Pseudalkalibacillus hwajinpoensis]